MEWRRIFVNYLPLSDTKGFNFPAPPCGSLLHPCPFLQYITDLYVVQGPDHTKAFLGSPALPSVFGSEDGISSLHKPSLSPSWGLALVVAVIYGGTDVPSFVHRGDLKQHKKWVYEQDYLKMLKTLQYWETTLIWQEHPPYRMNRRGEKKSFPVVYRTEKLKPRRDWLSGLRKSLTSCYPNE